VLPQLPVTAFISAGNLKKDNIAPDIDVDLYFGKEHCILPTKGKDITCFIDPGYDWENPEPKRYLEPALKHLKEEHIHVAILRLGDKGFQLVKK
jgi:hypothetical protein